MKFCSLIPIFLLFRMTKMTSVLAAGVLLCLLLSPDTCQSLNHGRGGVWDSPAATDQFVQQYGFLFGGGRSGVHGLQALQLSASPLHRPAPLHVSPSIIVADSAPRFSGLQPLSPLTINRQGRQNGEVVFSRFAAVPSRR